MTTSIVIQIPVTKKGGTHFFDVYIPCDVVHAYDVEADISGTTIPDTLGRQSQVTNMAGTIRLHIPGKAGLCYGASVRFKGSDLEEIIPGFSNVHGELAPLFFSPYYRHDYDSLLFTREIGGHVLYGCYEDIIGKQVEGDIFYMLTLTIWAEI